MDVSAKGAEFIRRHEGFVPRYYLDPVGIPTIGVGFTWRSDSFRDWWAANKGGAKFGPGATMTRDEADDALRYLISKEYGKAVNGFLGKKVPQHVFDGTVSPVFNLGAGALQWKWAAAVKRGDYAEAARLLRTTGTTAAGKKLPGLVRRRQEEAALLQHGDYGHGAVTAPADPMADGVLRRGEEGQAVLDLQRALALRGHYDGELDGIFGYGTEAAAMSFQRFHALTVDGVAGPATLGKIERLSPKPAQPPKPAPAPMPEPSAPEQPKSPMALIAGLFIALVAGAYAFLKANGVPLP